MPDIHIDNVSFAYSGASHSILRSINLDIPEGEFVLLAGPSGGGKSTLALLLAGLIPSRISGHLKGSIHIGDKNISHMDIHEASQLVGMVFQNPEEQLIHLDVESEVAFGPENLAIPRAEIAKRLEEVLGYTGMERFRKQETFALSGGQKQRIAIAATLAMQSRVLVLDEPTSDLDPVGTQEVLAVLRQLNKEFHMTIVLIEHKIDEIVPWVDRVILLDQGRVITDASPRQAFADSTQWRSRGVAVPQVVQLAQVLPDVFPDTTPLSVVEAYDALHDSPYAQIIRARNTARQQLNITPLVDSQTSNASSDPTSILAWEHVSLSYGAKQVLKDINLHVAAHEWLAIVGTNGSGKTSLASLAMGFQKPTQGVAYNHGKAVKAGKISLQAEKTAYLFQAADSMLFTESVEKEFLFGTQHRRTQRQAADVPFTVEQLLDIVDLKSYRTDNPFHLSHGQRKRLALGALLTRYPDTVILDEPTTGQDEGHARAFLQFLQQVQARHQLTYVMITHHMEAVANYATRMVVLKDGNIFMDDTPHRVFAHPDALATCGIIPPPIAQLYAQLCAGQAGYVELNVPDFLQALQIEKVVL